MAACSKTSTLVIIIQLVLIDRSERIKQSSILEIYLYPRRPQVEVPGISFSAVSTEIDLYRLTKQPCLVLLHCQRNPSATIDVYCGGHPHNAQQFVYIEQYWDTSNLEVQDSARVYHVSRCF